MVIKDLYEQHKVQKEMTELLHGLSVEIGEDYSMLYYPDDVSAKTSQKYAKVLFDLLKQSKESQDMRKYLALREIIQKYGKRQVVTKQGFITSQVSSKITLSLPKQVQSKLDSLYARHIDGQSRSII